MPMAARAGAPSAARVSERFPIAEVGRWRALLDREHATLAPVLDCARDGADLLVWREAPAARRVLDGRIPRHLRAALFLQATAAGAFFAAYGGAFGAADLEDLRWDAAAGEGRLWLTRVPPAAGAAAAVPDSLVGALSELLGKLFAPAERGTLGRDLASAGAARRRAEFWVAGALRAFPELSLPAAAGARERCLGLPGSRLRSLRARALSEKAKALVAGKSPRLFEPGRSPVEPGGALGLSPPPRSAADASRRLRAEAARAARDTRPVWIAVAPERWDALSRLSFEAARHALDDRVEIATVSELPAPDGPDAWRDAVWIPCGTVAGSVRFYEWLAEVAPFETSGCLARARAILASPGWAGFAADATGDAPLPALAGDPRPDAPKVRGAAGVGGGGAGARIESLLAAGRVEAALAEGEAWIRDSPGADGVAWFSLSARLAAEAGDRFVPWLEALEAEREVAGGRPVEARARLDRVAGHPASGPDDRRRATLRSAEVSVLIGESSAAARRAAAWRRAHPDAPAGESVRALRLGALGLAREGHADGALALLDEAERADGDLAAAERLETALARAQVLALAGRFEEEASLYERMRPAALAAGDDRLAARFLAQEARGLLDRREYGRAIVRLEEAMAVAADDPAERAALGIDLGATLYHAGHPGRSEEALEGAIAAAAAAGREDLARIARGNRIELLLDRCAFDAAEPEVAALERSARREKDERRLLVALHQRSRLALRRGDLEAAARDNAEARALAEAIGDRLEVGELWLEEGDRAAYAGDRDGARSAWERAAADPPDRCRTDSLARARLGELDGSSGSRGRTRTGRRVALRRGALSGGRGGRALDGASRS